MSPRPGIGASAWCAASTAPEKDSPVSCIADAQLSPDGTCILTTDYARRFSVYAFASDLSAQHRQHLAPYARFASANPIWAFAVNPYFDLNNPQTTTALVSSRDQYVNLHNALWGSSSNNEAPRQGPVDISSRLASYKLVDKLTEAVTAPMSLAWSPDGAYFYAGQRNKIAIFDLTYTEDPIATIRTIPSTRNKLKGGGWGFKGHVSALSACPPASSTNANALAAGTRTRYVGIYDAISSKEITHFALPGMVNGKRTDNPGLQDSIGDGITQLKWSPDGRYLYVAERSSDALLIYDVRNFSFTLGYCSGRKALTRQKMGFDVWTQMGREDEGGSHEIWAGGTDGKVRVWRDPCLRESALDADEVIDGGDGPTSNVLVHPYGHAAVVSKGEIEVGGEEQGRGFSRGGVTQPAYSEWGRLDILGLRSH